MGIPRVQKVCENTELGMVPHHAAAGWGFLRLSLPWHRISFFGYSRVSQPWLMTRSIVVEHTSTLGHIAVSIALKGLNFPPNRLHISPDRSFAGVQGTQIGEVALFRLGGAEALGEAKGPRP